MNKYIKSIVLSACVVLGTSCELDLLDNPNEVKFDNANPDFVLNDIQLSFAEFWIDMSEFGMDNTRMIAMFGNNYPNAYQATSFDDVWTNAYASVLQDAKLLESLHEDLGTLQSHLGIAKVLRAYTLMSLVDYFGDVPYSEALNSSNLNPVADDDASVYDMALTDLNDAITLFESVDAGTTPVPVDFFYGDGNAANWITVAKTLKLRYFIQTRLVNASSLSEINALITDGDLIDTYDEAFVFHYNSNSNSAPDTRHPWFTDNYITGADQYMSNSYINHMYIGKGGIQDPRLRHYFYRQTLTIPNDVNVLDCINQAKPTHYGSDDIFCSVGEGYWGRDHLDDDGTPPDTQVRTMYGLYPAGGQWDDDNGEPGTPDSGAKGAGILPIFLPSFVYFLQAESALILGTFGDARALMQSGVQSSIDYVRKFQKAFVDEASNNYPSDGLSNDFADEVMAEYDAQTTTSDRLEAIMKEFWIASWGNGIDMYNAYRRTGKPSDFQPALAASPGAFYRSLTYPGVYVNRNNNATQKTSPAVQVFWDTNPADFID